MRFFLFATAALLATTTGTISIGQIPDTTKVDQQLEAPTFDTPLDASLATEIDRLILELGSPDYREREAATRRLMEIGVPAFAKLRDEYHASDDLEVRLRMEVIVRDAYINHQVFDKTGYLGIQLSGQDGYLSHSNDARISVGRSGFKLGLIVEETAAARAGLLVNDIVTHLDGEPLGNANINAREAFTAFAKSIRKRGAGNKLSLTLLRRDQRLEIDVILGAAPLSMMNRINGMKALYNQSISKFYAWWADNFSTTPPVMVEHGAERE